MHLTIIIICKLELKKKTIGNPLPPSSLGAHQLPRKSHNKGVLTDRLQAHAGQGNTNGKLDTWKQPTKMQATQPRGEIYFQNQPASWSPQMVV